MKESTRHQARQYVLSFGHLCADMNQGMLSALIPFFIAAYHYDYTTAASLVMVSNIIGSVVQPIFGHLADKWSRPYLMIIGITLAGGGMAITGLISSFPGLCVCVVISGLGVAMYHPQGAQLVNRYSTASSKATNLGVFAFGGNMGFTLGPVLASGSISLFGLKGTLVIFLPSIIFGLLAAFCFREDLEAPEAETAVQSETDVHLPADQWGAFVKLGRLISCRSIIFSGVNTFLVMYFVDILGRSESMGSAMLSIYYAIAAFSSLFGGRLADHIGNKQTVVLAMATLLPSLALFAMTPYLLPSILLLIPMGIGISICYSPMVLMGQQYLPNHVGLASGVTLGLSVSIGGIFAPVLGRIGDMYGLTATFFVVAGLAILPLLLALTLKRPLEE